MVKGGLRGGERMRTGVLGGGLTGLAVASALPESEVLEKADRPGGLCRSITEEGFTFDYCGSHVLFSRDTEILGFVERTLGENLVRTRRNTKIYYKGRLVKYPFENGLRDLPLEDNYACLQGFLEAYIAREAGRAVAPRNFEEWMYFKFGPGISEMYLIPYNQKIWKTEPRDMSLEWVDGRVPDPPLEDILKASLGIDTEGYVHQLHFIYPREGGIESLPKAIADSCPSIVTDWEVTGVRKEGDAFVVTNGSEERVYDRLVSTIPLPLLVRLLEGTPPEVLEAASKLRVNSVVTVMLGVDRPEINDLSWLYFPRWEEGLFNRVSFPSNYSDLNAPPGTSSVLAEITCRHGDDVWTMEDEDLVDHVVTKLDDHGLVSRGEVVFSKVARVPRAYVVFTLGFPRNAQIVRDYVEGQGIRLCGRQGELRYINTDACLRSAFDLAKTMGG
jgi:protoporphyrinogen oxidase